MWPKALAQLIELLPHLSRLVPLADRFLASKSVDTEANARAMEAMAEGLRGDLGQVAAAHSGIYRQLNELDTKTTAVSSEVRQLRAELEARMARSDRDLVTIHKLAVTSVALLAILVVLVLIVLFRHH